MTDSAVSPTDDQFTVWTAALTADYLPVAPVVRWADEQILARDELPAWLLDLALVSSPEKAAWLLYEAREEQANVTQQRGSLRGQAEGMLIVGFLFLRYERNEFTPSGLLLAAGARADGMDCGCDSEDFYQLLNELEGHLAATSVERPWAERFDELFSPFAELARRCMPLLPAR